MSVISPEHGSATTPAPTTRQRPMRVALIGTGGRASLFLQGLAVAHRTHGRLVAMCDLNPVRLEHYQQRLTREWNHPAVETFGPDQFGQMVQQTRPDVVVVCTPDRLHPEHCTLAMEHGCDVIVEKPIAIDAAGCRAILAAEQATGRRVRVSFNCRYIPWALMIKRLLAAGTIGQVLSADCEWMLDARKGVQYFARWHAEKDQSGGLLVHKATHHLDLMNWWLDAVPQTVFAFGQRGFFGADNRHKHGIGPRTPEHYMDQPAGGGGDPFAPLPPSLENHRTLYLEASRVDGYRPDRSVWRDHAMDIEDSMSLQVRYASGAILSYRLNAFLPRPGSHVVFNGTRGRLEIHHEPGGRVQTQAQERVPQMPDDAAPATWRSRCIVHPLFGDAYEAPIPAADGGHEGSDPQLLDRLFGLPAPDPWNQVAGAEQGIASAAIGIAGNRSIETGLPVNIADLVPALAGAVKLSDLR